MASQNHSPWLRPTENISTSSRLRMGPVTSSGKFCFVSFSLIKLLIVQGIVRLGFILTVARDLTKISTVLLLEVQWIKLCQERMREVKTLTRPRDKNISKRIIMARKFLAISTGPLASAITWSAQTAADLLWEYICQRDLTRIWDNILSEILRGVLLI